jgi:hypothetical protein
MRSAIEVNLVNNIRNPEGVFFYSKERDADVILFKGEGKAWIGKNALLLIQKS